jgi:hypothetical protein
MSSHPTDQGTADAPASQYLSARQLRELLTARFAMAGYTLEADHPLSLAGSVLTVDAYDPRRRAGFLVRDATSANPPSEPPALRAPELGLLVVHPSDIPSIDVLERRLDAFFAALQTR